jgi:hypothetical protein
MWEAEDKISDRTTIRYITRQATTQEKKEFEGLDISFEEFEARANAIDYTQLAPYDPNEHPEIVDLLKALPQKPKAKMNPKPTNSSTLEPTCGYCKHPTSQHTEAQCMKKKADLKAAGEAESVEKTTSSDNTKPLTNKSNAPTHSSMSSNDENKSSKRTCHTCGAVGHLSYNCPKKGVVSSFLAQVRAAEATFGDNLGDKKTEVYSTEMDLPEPSKPLGDVESRAVKVMLGLGWIKDDKHQEGRIALMALDTFASHNIFAPGVGDVLKQQDDHKLTVKGYGGKLTPIGSKATMRLKVLDQQEVILSGYQALQDDALPTGCDVLVCKTTMKTINLDLNHHLYSPAEVPIPLQFLPQVGATHNTGRAGEACEPWTGTVPVECVVGRVKLTNAGKMPAASRAVVDNLVMTRL